MLAAALVLVAAPALAQSTQTKAKEPSRAAIAAPAEPDVPRIEIAARLVLAGRQDAAEYKAVRDNAARELAGRADGVGAVSTSELKKADDVIARQVAILQKTQPPPAFAESARMPGRPQIEGLKLVYINPLGELAASNRWKHIIAHQTEGPAGAARPSALAQYANPTKRGVTVWVETDGTIYWATAEHLIPLHGDGFKRNDNKYIDNSKTYRIVLHSNSIGVEFAGNYPDVRKPVTPEQMRSWLVLVRFLQERYAIPAEHVYAHNWVDYKDSRYCEGCDLATEARKLNYVPQQTATDQASGRDER
jgi:hypothetical protein